MNWMNTDGEVVGRGVGWVSGVRYAVFGGLRGSHRRVAAQRCSDWEKTTGATSSELPWVTNGEDEGGF